MTPVIRVRGLSVGADLLVGLALAIVLIVVSFAASGGVDLAPNTWVQVGLVAVGAAVAVVLVLLSPARPRWGLATVLLFSGLAALTYASIAWSVQPANSWLEANRTLSYLGAFAAAAGLARMWPGRWRAVIGGVATAATAVSLYALIVKVFPATLDAGDPLGRLRAPFDYWNAVGLMSAMGIPACLWAGARREPAPVLRALTVPAIAILIPALLLSYSRGALIVAVIGTALWFALVPLRLRAAAVLAPAALGGGGIAAWALATHSISADGVALSARDSAGHGFGVVLVVILALTAAAGFAVAFATDRVMAPRLRRRIGAVLIALVALVPVGGLVALASSSRGLTGEISHMWHQLTNPNGVVSDKPGRLVQLSNSRPSYWSEGLKIGEHHLIAGSGALGFATAHSIYSKAPLINNVQHAHSYLIETFADFGLIGLFLTLALLGAWAVAAGRALRTPESGRGPPAAAEAWKAEQLGLLTLLTIVVMFGLHSLIDWTWFIPGTAILALICAGWLAGRGSLSRPAGQLPVRRRLSRRPAATAVAVAVVVLTVVSIWVIVQPLRSSDADAAAVDQLIRGHAGAALADARSAAASNPVSIDPLFLQSGIYTVLGNPAAARDQLVKATQLQPSNPSTWQRLGCYDLDQHRPADATRELRRAYVLEPAQTALVRQPIQFCTVYAA